jgi:hypothetical protein
VLIDILTLGSQSGILFLIGNSAVILKAVAPPGNQGGARRYDETQRS